MFPVENLLFLSHFYIYMLGRLKQAKVKLIKNLKDIGILKTPEIIHAFEKVPREDFMLPEYKKHAYVDEARPILAHQTISQPYTIAVMTESLEPNLGHKILEIGSGSGYQSAILSEIVGQKGKIVSIERIPELYDYAKSNLINYKNIELILEDGTLGYPKEAPYDRIIVTAAAPTLPNTLFSQLKEQGIMIIPITKNQEQNIQEMYKIIKVSGEQKQEILGTYGFVPLIGKYGYKSKEEE